MNKLMALLLTVLLGVACGGAFTKDVRGFIEGSYVRQFETEFAAGIDSVVLQERGEGHYAIIKYSRFSRIKNGEWQKEETTIEKMAGVFDPDKQVINELKKGKVLRFDAEDGKMFIGGSEYRKVY